MNNDRPEIIYHYTNQEGLLGILREGALWATHINYMNDSSEMVEPFNIAEDILEEYGDKWISGADFSDEERKEIEIGGNFLVDIKSGGGNIFVVSFCNGGDVLSQWRGYGGYNSAYSIGFNVKKLMNDEVSRRFKFDKCIYYPRDKYKKEIESYIMESIESVMNDTMSRTDFLDDFTRKAGVMKLDYFANEDEWRIISNGPIASIDSKISYRKGKSTIIPYYSIKIDIISTIVEIMVGPCENPGLAKSAITSLAYKYDLKEVLRRMVKNSDIPYRML